MNLDPRAESLEPYFQKNSGCVVELQKHEVVLKITMDKSYSLTALAKYMLVMQTPQTKLLYCKTLSNTIKQKSKDPYNYVNEYLTHVQQLITTLKPVKFTLNQFSSYCRT